MRKVIVSNFTSLDGYVSGVGNDVMAFPSTRVSTSTTWNGPAAPTPCSPVEPPISN